MQAFAIEILGGRTWQRLDTIYWTRQIAERESRELLRRGKGCQVRILSIDVGLDAIATIEAKEGDNNG